YCSQAWTRYTGAPSDAAHGWGWAGMVHPDEAPGFDELWRGVLASRGVLESEVRLRRADGAYRWHLVRAVPEHDDGGDVSGWIGTYTDCHDLKAAHAATIEAIQVRDEFLSIASHELRTPLTALQLQLEGLAEQVTEA